jgi:protein TonB
MSYPGQSALARRNPAGIVFVIGLHVMFILALAAGLKIRTSIDPPRPMSAAFLPSEPVKSVEPQVPQNPTRPLFVEDPKIHSVPLPPDDPVVPELTTPPGPVAMISPARPGYQPVIAEPGVDARAPLSQPPYPPAAIRDGIEGNLALEVLVGSDGRVRDARVLRSSGSALLDRSAIDEARRHWKLRPATRDGVPFEKWYTLKVTFNLLNR